MKALTWHGKDEIDPSFVAAHRASLEQGPEPDNFRAKKDGCIKVAMKRFGA